MDVRSDALPIKLRIFIDDVRRRLVAELPVQTNLFKFVVKCIRFSQIVRVAKLTDEVCGFFRRPDGLPYDRPEDDDEDRSAGSRIKTAFRGACKRAKIADFHPHDCRHTFATWHYAHNRDLTALMRLGGWKDIKSVIRYMHVNVDELRETIDRLPGGNLGDVISAEARTA